MTFCRFNDCIIFIIIMKNHLNKGFIMGISSLGVGSGILTQDVLDQLRKVDEEQRIRPITLNLANENDKKDALKLIDASMTNYIDSINELKTLSLWDERKAEVTSGSSVEVSAILKTDIQDFTLEVTSLATKQIEQSGDFSAKTAKIDPLGLAGSFDIQVGTGKAITIKYDAGATLKDMKNLINKEVDSSVNATIVQVGSGKFRLFLSSKETGDQADTNISISGSGINSKLSTDFNKTAIQSGTNATFTFNGQAISRANNTVDDLITGLTITLKETGVSKVSISQDRATILEKFDSFVEKYNSIIAELERMTKPGIDSENRGIFSSNSTIKNMKATIRDILESVGGGVSSIFEYGLDIKKDGKLSLDKVAFKEAMDDKPRKLQAFFSGGDFPKGKGGSIVPLTGAFADMSTKIESYTKANQILDQIKESFSQNISILEDRKISTTERLDSKYSILKKQFAAYDLLINRFNATSSMFTQMVNPQKER